MTDTTTIDPDSPYAPDGREWWKPRSRSGGKARMGGQNLIAAYLWHNKLENDLFTMKELRTATGEDGAPNQDEHLNRRLRDLKKHGWQFESYKDRQGQKPEQYVLNKKGARTWLGEKGAQSDIVSAKTRREVFQRNGNRCVICGIGAGEPYPDDPTRKARMTIGHRKANSRLADASPENLQTECSLCNEPVNDSPPDPENLVAVMAEVKRLHRDQKTWLLECLEAGRRIATANDAVWDRVRRLGEVEKEEVIEILRSWAGGTSR